MAKKLLKILLIPFLLSTSIFSLISLNNHFMKKFYFIKYKNFISKYSKEYNISEYLIYAVIKTESDFNKDSKSKSNAIGLMQLTEETFNWLQEIKDGKITLNKESLLIPETNIKYGTYFLSFLLNKYEAKETALSAYNAGIGTVNKWLKDYNISKNGKILILENIPFKETKDYVKRVFHAEKAYKSLYSKK